MIPHGKWGTTWPPLPPTPNHHHHLNVAPSSTYTYIFTFVCSVCSSFSFFVSSIEGTNGFPFFYLKVDVVSPPPPAVTDDSTHHVLISSDKPRHVQLPGQAMFNSLAACQSWTVCSCSSRFLSCFVALAVRPPACTSNLRRPMPVINHNNNNNNNSKSNLW